MADDGDDYGCEQNVVPLIHLMPGDLLIAYVNQNVEEPVSLETRW